MHRTDLIIFNAIILGITILGASFFRHGKGSYDYMTASRNMPGWLLAFSFVATYINVVSFMGLPGGVFLSNWNKFVFVIPVPIMAWAAARWAVPYYRNQRDPSAFAQMEQRFGPVTRRYAGACYLLSQVLRQSVIIFMVAMVFHEMLGWNTISIIVSFTAVTTLYAVMGGLRGVVWTQAVQGLIMMVGVAMCIVVLGRAMPGGLENAMPQALINGKFSLGEMSFSLSQATIPMLLLIAFFGHFDRYFIDQSHIQRYNAAQTNREARQAVIHSCWMYVGTAVTLFLIGTMLYCYYSEFTILLSEVVPHDYIFPFFIINQMPVGTSGFVLAAMYCSAMASQASCITSSSLTVLNDMIGHRSIYYGERRRKAILRASGIGVSLVSMLMAIGIEYCSEWANPWWVLSVTMTGSLVGMLLLCFMARRATQADTIIAITCGLMVSGWVALWWWVGLPDTGLNAYLADILGTIAAVLIGMLLALRHDRKNNATQEQERHV